MADIRGYNAPVTPLRPAEGGFAALETAGRRTGISYREAATDYARIGQLQQRTIEANRWPFDILELEKSAALRGRGGGGGAPRVRESGGFGHAAINAGMGALGGYMDIQQRNELAAYREEMLGAAGYSGWGSGINLQPGRAGELVDVTGGTVSFGHKPGQTISGTDPYGRLFGAPQSSDLRQLETSIEGTAPNQTEAPNPNGVNYPPSMQGPGDNTSWGQGMTVSPNTGAYVPPTDQSSGGAWSSLQNALTNDNSNAAPADAGADAYSQSSGF